MPQLDPQGRPVPVGQAVFRTPGLSGTVTRSRPVDVDGFRSNEMFDRTLRSALRESGVEALDTYEIAGTREVNLGGTPTRSAGGEPGIVVQLPAPEPGWSQVILASDEADVMSWHVPEEMVPAGGDATPSQGGGPSRGAGPTQTFVIRRTVPPPSTVGGTAPSRGLISSIGRKVLQVLVFRAVEIGGGLVAEWAAARWEAAKRPYRVRGFDPASYTDPDVPIIDGPGWQALSQGPALLILHGTFSRAHSGFGACPRGLVEYFQAQYQRRVVAFDHFTLSATPDENVDELLKRIPSGTDLEFDVLTHSRGGLVARALAARQGALAMGDRRVRIRNVAFVASPNGGTTLADSKYMGQFVDRYTNLLSLLPDVAALDILVTVIDVVKHLAMGALDALSGLQAMLPGGQFLNALPASLGTDSRTYAVGSDYEPGSSGWARVGALVADGVIDRVFGTTPNDLVVPTAGGWELGEGRKFKLTDRFQMAPAAAVDHCAYFSDAAVGQRLSGWLTG